VPSTQRPSTGPTGQSATKQCRTCGTHRPLSDYRGARSDCKPCGYEAAKKRRSNNPEAYAVSQAKYRAKKRGLEFNITDDYIKSIDTNLCPYLDIPIYWNISNSTDGRASDNSKSIDRIDSAKGYVKGNVVVCSWRANSILKNATLPEMELIARNFRRILEQTHQ